MILAHIAAITVVASTSAIIAAQQGTGSGPLLTIQVTDVSGAPIPKAQIQIMSPEEGKLLAFAADSQGTASLHLPPGEYQYRIAFPAFCPRNGITTIDPVWPQKIAARLDVVSCPGCEPCVTPVGAEPAGYPVAVRVTDPIGAVISDALVEVDPASSSSWSTKTDATGEASIGLPVGTHLLRVSAFGFRNWNGFAEVQGTKEVVTAKLRLGGTSDPEISIEVPPEIPLYMPQPGPITLQAFETLPLPGVPIRRPRESKHQRTSAP